MGWGACARVWAESEREENCRRKAGVRRCWMLRRPPRRRRQMAAERARIRDGAGMYGMSRREAAYNGLAAA